MPMQEVLAGLIVAGAVGYVVRRMRGRKDEAAPKGPDVPVSRLSRKRSKGESCGH